MELRSLQNALACLYTDEAARRRFDEDPAGFCVEFGLSREQLAQLRAGLPAGIREFAQLILDKKVQEMKRWTPLTLRCLGTAYGVLARKYFALHPGEHPGPMENALGFLRWGLEQGAGRERLFPRGVAAMEAMDLRMRFTGRRFGFGLFWMPRVWDAQWAGKSHCWRAVFWWRPTGSGGRLVRFTIPEMKGSG